MHYYDQKEIDFQSNQFLENMFNMAMRKSSIRELKNFITYIQDEVKKFPDFAEKGKEAIKNLRLVIQEKKQNVSRDVPRRTTTEVVND